MKIYYTYELRNQQNQVEYVGESTNPNRRFRQHTINTPLKGNGYFHGREDLTLVIDNAYLTRKEAFKREGELKLRYGFEWTEFETRKKIGKEKGSIQGRKNVENGHWSSIQSLGGKIGGKIGGKMTGATNIQKAYISWKCEFCGKEGKGKGNYSRAHGEKCKFKK